MTIEVTDTQSHGRPRMAEKIEQLWTRASDRLALGIRTHDTRYGLSRHLAVPIASPSAKIPISVRPLQERDLAPLFSLNAASDAGERREAAWRRGFIDKGARRGFVAVDERTGAPCYVQWLFVAEDNDFIRQHKSFPALEPGQALLENAYTPPAFRGKGIMSAAMAQIAERAADLGAREVLTFVAVDNIASLKGCQRAGFNPSLLHHCVRLGFGMIRRDLFEALPQDDPRRTEKF